MIFKGRNLTKKQLELAQTINSSSAKYFVLKASRQSGKTVLAEQMLLSWCLNNPKVKLMFTSPVYRQSKKVFTSIVNAIEKSKCYTKINHSDLEINFINGSVAIFRGVESVDNLRGETLDFMICDEFAFYKPDTFSKLKPMTDVRGKKVLLISTPFGKNDFYDAYHNNSHLYQKLDMSYLDNPFYNLDEVEEARKSLPPNIFKQEYLAQWVDDGIVFSNIEKVRTLEKVEGVNFYAGIDVGSVNDYTVITILNEKCELVEIKRFVKMTYSHIKDELIKIINKYNCQTLIEINIERLLYELLDKECPNVENWITSPQSKNPLIENLIYAFETETIKLPKSSTDDLNALINELNIFCYEFNLKSRRVSYGAPNNKHDDCVMSLAIALECYNRNKYLSNWDYTA